MPVNTHAHQAAQQRKLTAWARSIYSCMLCQATLTYTKTATDDTALLTEILLTIEIFLTIPLYR